MKTRFAALLIAVISLMVLVTACQTEDSGESVLVTFDSNGGAALPSISIARGSSLGAKFPVPQRNGSVYFLGWYEGYDEYTSDTIINVDVTLVAGWTLDTSNYVTVTFDDDGGTLGVTNYSLPTGSSVGPNFPAAPRKQGFRFVRWHGPPTLQLPQGRTFGPADPILGDIVLMAEYTALTQHTVTLSIPTAHQAVNPGLHGKEFLVYHGDGIDEWEKRFPTSINLGPDPNVNQYWVFFRWSDGGTIGGLIYNEHTPIESSITLGPFIAGNFHPREFDIDLSTVALTTPAAGTPGTHTGGVVRTPFANPYNYDAETGWVTATFTAVPSFLYFQNNTDLVPLLASANADYGNMVRFEVEYEFVDPERDTTIALFNFMIANLRQNDNWNSTAVNGLTLEQITGDDEVPGATHNIAGTNSSHNGANRGWLVIRAQGAEITENGPLTVIFKSIKVHLVQ